MFEFNLPDQSRAQELHLKPTLRIKESRKFCQINKLSLLGLREITPQYIDCGFTRSEDIINRYAMLQTMTEPFRRRSFPAKRKIKNI